VTGDQSCEHGVLREHCADCRYEQAKHERSERLTDYDRAKLAAVDTPPEIDAVIRHRCGHPGCWNDPRPNLRNCYLHRATEPASLDSSSCEFPGDVEGLHDHTACIRKKAQKGYEICGTPACWRPATVIGYCTPHSASVIV